MIRKYPVTVVGGAGTWGRCYVYVYARHPDCEVVGLVDRAGDRRQMFADRYGITQVYDRLEDLLAEDLPDIVSAGPAGAIMRRTRYPNISLTSYGANLSIVQDRSSLRLYSKRSFNLLGRPCQNSMVLGTTR